MEKLQFYCNRGKPYHDFDLVGKEEYILANNVNKQRFIILMNERLEAAGIKTFHAKCDADVSIVLEVLATKYAINKATTLVCLCCCVTYCQSMV